MLGTLKINNFVYQSYRQFVKGNHCLDIETVAKKLTRNVILGFPLPVENTDHVWYAYGKLRILVKYDSEVVCILNNQPEILGWEVDEDVKENLNKLLGIY